MAVINTKVQHHVAPAQSQLARYIVADLKGGEANHAFRLSLVESAIREALKGNYNAIREAMEFAIGKSRKAAAYQAGFASIANAASAFYPDGWEKGGIAKVAYTGKLDSASNSEARAAIDLQTGVMITAFESAYVAHDAQAAAEAKAKAAANKAKKLAEQPAAPAPVSDAVEMDIGDAVHAIAAALSSGALSVDEVTALRVAMSAYDSLQSAGAVEVLPAASESPVQVAA
jgi:hypothetical protein